MYMSTISGRGGNGGDWRGEERRGERMGVGCSGQEGLQWWRPDWKEMQRDSIFGLFACEIGLEMGCSLLLSLFLLVLCCFEKVFFIF